MPGQRDLAEQRPQELHLSDSAQVLGHACDAEQALDLLRALGHGQLLIAVPAELARGENDAQAGRVDELELLQVEYDQRLVGELGVFDRTLE